MSHRPDSRGENRGRRTLVIGGARAGKTAYAQSVLLAERQPAGWRPLYLATGWAGDAEMAARIERHRKDRGDAWETLEEPLALPEVLGQIGDRPVLVDCLTLWISNLMAAGKDIAPAVADLSAATERSSARIVFVTNEVGLGIVPDNAMAREFRDHAGFANQAMAACCDTVVLVAAGLPLILKGQA